MILPKTSVLSYSTNPHSCVLSQKHTSRGRPRFNKWGRLLRADVGIVAYERKFDVSAVNIWDVKLKYIFTVRKEIINQVSIF